jgi:hypothetical protein
MKFSVIVKANARKNSVQVQDDGGLLVQVTVPPIEGRANKKVIELLAKFLNKPKSSFSIRSGQKSRYKIVEVL